MMFFHIHLTKLLLQIKETATLEPPLLRTRDDQMTKLQVRRPCDLYYKTALTFETTEPSETIDATV
jgi:hypothetical protein